MLCVEHTIELGSIRAMHTANADIRQQEYDIASIVIVRMSSFCSGYS